MYQLVCNDFQLCTLLNHLITLFVHHMLHHLSVYFVTCGSFHSMAFSSYVFVVTFTSPVHLHPPVCCGRGCTICHHTFIMCSVLYISRHTCLLLLVLAPNNNYFALLLFVLNGELICEPCYTIVVKLILTPQEVSRTCSWVAVVSSSALIAHSTSSSTRSGSLMAFQTLPCRWLISFLWIV